MANNYGIRNANKLEHGIHYSDKTDTYYVNLGKCKTHSFPTYEDAKKFRDEIYEERAKLKTEKVKALLRKNEIDEIEQGRPYPYNAMEACSVPLENQDEEYFLSLLKCLTERELTCFEHYFEKGMTLAEVGKEFGVGRERIRQIVSKASRKLAVRMARREKEQELELKHLALVEDMKALNGYREQLVELFKEKGIYTKEMEIEFGSITTSEHRGKLNITILEKDIEDLDLSVRTNNVLRRAGVKNVDELICHTEDEVRHIRNMGKKSFKEIQDKLNKLGLSLKDEGGNGK